VFTRQVLHSPSTWSEELSKILFVWLAFAGSAFLFGERGHIAVDFIARKLPLSAQRILQVIVQIVILVFAVLAMIWGGYLAASIAWNQQMTALPLTLGWVYVIIPIAGVGRASCREGVCVAGDGVDLIGDSKNSADRLHDHDQH